MQLRKRVSPYVAAHRSSLALERLESRLLLSGVPKDGGGTRAGDWTVMVYVDGDNNLEEAALDDFLEVASVNTGTTVSVVMQIDRTPGYDTSYGNWTYARRGEVNFGDTPTSSWGTGIGEVNMADPDTLVDFVDWAMTNYSSTRYALILWDHGGGWRSGGDGAARDSLWDDSSGGDYLENHEIAEALAAVPHIDLFGFDCCLMGMVENAYSAVGEASVFVASQETEPWDGWPYDTIAADLAADPLMTPAELGDSIATRYGQFYGDGTMSAVDLTQVDALSTAISDMATTIMTDATSYDYSQLLLHYWNAEHFSAFEYVDIGSFLASVAADGTMTASISASGQVALAAYNSAVLSDYSGSSFNATGLSIYFPEPGGSVDPAYNGSLIGFAAGTEWDEFLGWWVGGAIAGPSVIAHTPPGATIDPQTSVVFEFSEPMDPASFSLADVVAFNGPSGDLLGEITGFSWLASDELEVTFNQQTDAGSYAMVIGPDITDLSGMAMDQDGDSVAGELVDDQYSAMFHICDEIYGANMDTNPGWSLSPGVGSYKWAWGVPQGNGSGDGDPTAGYTGSYVLGYNLAGDYPNDMSFPQYATMPTMDCTGYENVSLTFYRWLGVEGYYDDASIQLSLNGSTWTTIWSSGEYGTSDYEWTFQQFDISAWADGQPNVHIRFAMGPTDFSVVRPGWNLDDVVVLGLPAGPDTHGATAAAHMPSGAQGPGQNSMIVVFDEAMDTTSFDVGDDVVSFNGPAGDLMGMITGFSWLDAYSLQINFNAVSQPGPYEMTIGPDILDLAGNPMDQDGDLVNGEVPDDHYIADFTIRDDVIYSATMDTDPLWVLGSGWEWGVPLGGGSWPGDPTSGYTGSSVIGYNLSGDYTNNLSPRYATTPAIDCSDFEDVSFSFYRWLGVESSSWDHASIQVSNNGVTWSDVWTNGSASISDMNWLYQEFDISSVADGHPAVFIRWVMGSTDSSITYPGWNIDDVLVTGTPTATGIIEGYKWHDLNEDGVWDAGEPALEDWTIFLDNNDNGVLDFGEPTALTDAAGHYSFTGLANGDYIVAEVMPHDGWRQTLPGGPDYTITVTVTPPFVTLGVDFGNFQFASAPVGVPDLLPVSDTGVSTADDETMLDNSAPGTALQFSVANTLAGATVNLYADGTLIGSAVAAGTTTTVTTNGSFDLIDGAHDITAAQVEPVIGVESSHSTALSVTVDSIAPAAPGSPPDLQAGSDSGITDDDDLTNSTSPTFDVASPAAYFRFYQDAVLISGLYQAGATYAAAGLVEGDWSYTYAAVDAAGNESAPSGGLDVTIDTTAGAQPPILDLQAASDSGVDDDNVTMLTDLTFDTVAAPYFRIYRDGVMASQPPLLGDDGSVYRQGASELLAGQPYGTHAYTVVGVDAAGNETIASDPLYVLVTAAGPIASNVYGDGVIVTVYDMDTRNGTSAPNIAWDRAAYARGVTEILVDPGKIGDGVISSISLYGDGANTADIGVFVENAGGLDRFMDRRDGTPPVSVLACSGYVRSADFEAGLAGADVNGFATETGWRFPIDLDGDGATDDMAGLYALGEVRSFKADGDVDGDVVVDGDLRSVQVRGGDLNGDVVLLGSALGRLDVRGVYDREAGVLVGGDIAGTIRTPDGAGSVSSAGGDFSGAVESGGPVGRVNVRAMREPGGGVVGGDFSGAIQSDGGLRSISVANDFTGRLVIDGEAGRAVVGGAMMDALVNVAAGGFGGLRVGGDMDNVDVQVENEFRAMQIGGRYHNSTVVAGALCRVQVGGRITQDGADGDTDYLWSLGGPFALRSESAAGIVALPYIYSVGSVLVGVGTMP